MNRAVSRAVEIGFASTEARTTLLHHGKGPAAKKVSGYCQRMDLLNVKYCQQSPRQNVGWAVSVVKPESKYWLQREKWNRSICSLASSASLSPSICWSSSSKPSQLKKRPSRKLGNDQGRQRGQHIARRTYKSQSSAEHCSTLPLGVFQLLVDLTGHKDKVDKVLRELTFFPSVICLPFLNHGQTSLHFEDIGMLILIAQAGKSWSKKNETRSNQVSFVPSRFRF